MPAKKNVLGATSETLFPAWANVQREALAATGIGSLKVDGDFTGNLQVIGNAFGVIHTVNIGGALMPVAFQVEPAGTVPDNTAGPVTMVLSSVLATIPSLLGGMTGTSTGTPATFRQGSASCPSNVCTITAGTYPGGIVIGPGVTFNFAANGTGATKNYFVLLNGNLVISTQARLGSGSNNFTFLRLLFSGIGDDDAACGLFLGSQPADHNAVVQWAEFCHMERS